MAELQNNQCIGIPGKCCPYRRKAARNLGPAYLGPGWGGLGTVLMVECNLLLNKEDVIILL